MCDREAAEGHRGHLYLTRRERDGGEDGGGSTLTEDFTRLSARPSLSSVGMSTFQTVRCSVCRPESSC